MKNLLISLCMLITFSQPALAGDTEKIAEQTLSSLDNAE